MTKNELPGWANHSTAVELLAAFRRIVAGKPQIVDVKARLTKSLVASEAGFQRSTLSKHRYPDLCKLILAEQSRKGHASTATQKLAQKASANQKLRERIRVLEEERGRLLSQLATLGQVYAEKCRQLRALTARSGTERT